MFQARTACWEEFQQVAFEVAQSAEREKANMSDLHISEASRIFQVPEDQVTPEMRARAKVASFYRLYGGNPSRLAHPQPSSPTGRQSSLPVRRLHDELFIPARLKATVLVTLDFSELELKVLSSMAGRLAGWKV